ncbi:unnamed protein product [Echinostoma caproni]|uniref:DNA excision repair protein ERCC-6 n=1 Tax=Echinostoma caproni TaxID=27848 RepID=A0A183AE95_9TREM|nr:unnamed protein product [Echinostoma caproni]
MKNIDTLNSRKASLQKKLELLLKEKSNRDVVLEDSPMITSDQLCHQPSTSNSNIETIKPVPVQTAGPLIRTSKICSEDIQEKIKKLRKAEKQHLDDASLTNFQTRLRRHNQLDALERELARERGEVIAFLAAIHHSEQLASQNQLELLSNTLSMGSVLLVCPATVLQQWLNEFHSWYPAIRVGILHSSGSGYQKPASLIRTMASQSGCVLLTTYNTLVVYQDMLTQHAWSYVILDEGHKIKNPEAEITLAVKRFQTVHRIILSGSPMQNNLRELWSLFDFVCPGRLGPLPEFMQQFAVPITQGGYASSSPLQVVFDSLSPNPIGIQDILMPFLIRRLKAEVRLQLPNKSEQASVSCFDVLQYQDSLIHVLFCRLTDYQRQLYQEFTDSQVCKDLLNGKGNVFTALILLRKLCNHPDLVTGGTKDMLGDEATCRAREAERGNECNDEFLTRYPWSRFGCPLRSSKMLVVASLLKTWNAQGHRALVFSQSRRMLTVLERLVTVLRLSYLRMDGSTPVHLRQTLIRQFNSSVPDSDQSESRPFAFLLTTRVGGLGVNLTAANRVLIYDPDWNPSTDIQARERAWRIGQQQSVLIYRLLTSGTIEEKIYHRQIFKQFLTNRILRNPRQQRFFKTNDLQELLTFDDPDSHTENKSRESRAPETAIYLRSEGLGHTISRSKSTNRFDLLHQRCQLKSTSPESDEDVEVEDADLGDESSTTVDTESALETARRDRLRQLARELSRRIAEGRVDAEKPLFSRDSVRSGQKRRGTRVDGVRLTLVDRRTTYDTGDTERVKKSKTSSSSVKDSPTNSSSTSIHQKQSTDPDTPGRIQSDVFLSALLQRDPPTSESSDRNSTQLSNESSSWEIIARKRAALDDDMRQEAIRVARLAKEAIQRYSMNISTSPAPEKSNSNGSLNSSCSAHKRAYSTKQASSTSKKKRSGEPQTVTERQTLNRGIRSDHRDAVSINLPQVSHVVAHDQLIDCLTNVERVDTSFYRLETHRLIVRAIDTLRSEVTQSSQMVSFSSHNLPIGSITPESCKRFGLLKDRFLWNPQEEQSTVYVSLSPRTLESVFKQYFCN